MDGNKCLNCGSVDHFTQDCNVSCHFKQFSSQIGQDHPSTATTSFHGHNPHGLHSSVSYGRGIIANLHAVTPYLSFYCSPTSETGVPMRRVYEPNRASGLGTPIGLGRGVHDEGRTMYQSSDLGSVRLHDPPVSSGQHTDDREIGVMPRHMGVQTGRREDVVMAAGYNTQLNVDNFPKNATSGTLTADKLNEAQKVQSPHTDNVSEPSEGKEPSSDRADGQKQRTTQKETVFGFPKNATSGTLTADKLNEAQKVQSPHTDNVSEPSEGKEPSSDRADGQKQRTTQKETDFGEFKNDAKSAVTESKETNYEAGEKDVQDMGENKSKKSDTENNNDVDSSTKGETMQQNDVQDGKGKSSTGSKEETSDACTEEKHTDTEEKDQPVFGQGKQGMNRNTDEKSKAQKSGNSQQYSKVEVNFHVILSPKFEFVPHEDEVYIRFHAKELGGFKEYKWKMNFNRELEEEKGYMEMHGTVSIPQYLLSGNQDLKYKYVVLKAAEKSSTQWEFLLEEGIKGEIVDRQLVIPADRLEVTKVWHQYDGAIHKKPKEGIKEKISSWFRGSTHHKSVVKETKIAFKAMLPKWVGFGNDNENQTVETPAEQILNEIKQIYFSAKRYFPQENMDELKDVLFQFIYPQLRGFGIQSGAKEQPEESELRLAAGVLIVCLISTCHLSLGREELTSLCHALCLKPSVKQVLHDLKGLDKHYPQMKTKLKDYLKTFMLDICTEVPMWVLVIPLYHLLRDGQKNERKKYLKSNHTSDEWWGTSGLNEHIKRFQYSIKLKDRDIAEYWKNLQPLLGIDHYLSRTLMALLTWKKLTKDNLALLTPEAALANICYSLKQPEKHDFLQEFEILIDGIRQKRADIQTLSDEGELHCEILRAQMQADITLDVLQVISCDCYYGELTVIAATELCAQIILNGEMAFNGLQACTKAKVEKDAGLKLEEIYTKLFEFTKNWVNTTRLCDRIGSEYAVHQHPLEVFSRLLNIDFGVNGTKQWSNNLMRLFAEKYSKLTPVSYVNYYCFEDFSRYNSLIEKFFMDKSFDAVEDIVKGKADMSKLLDTFSTNVPNEKIKSFLSRVFNAKWPKDENEKNILDFVISWPAFVRYLSLFYGAGKDQSKSLLSEEIEVKIAKSLSVYTDVITQLKKGTVSLTKVADLVDKEEGILTVQKAMEDADSSNSHEDCVLEHIIGWRRKELEAFHHQKRALAGFAETCEMLNADVHQLTEKLQKNENNLQICEVCQPQEFADKKIPVITYFGISAKLLSVAEQLQKLQESDIFVTLLKMKKVRKSRYGHLTVENIVDDIILPVIEEFRKLADSLRSGTITLDDTRMHFKSYKGRYDKLESEFREMSRLTSDNDDDGSWIKKRCQQVEQSFRLSQYRSAARVMQKFVDQFQLQGDFSKLKVLLAEKDNKKVTLKTINESLLRAGKSLLEINEQKKQCLQEFINCNELVKWLQESLKGPSEVKLLVDLALMTASGQGDMEVYKVKCLHAATIGYAPLIYELKPGAGFDKFMDILKSVWRSLESDPELPSKLKTIQQNIEWLKKVKESKGSMEMSAFKQVEKINNKGIYKVGKINKETNPKLVEEAVQLVIPKSEGEDNSKVYTYQQLNDLQSKLMLVAGKASEGKEQVDRFVEIFDGVTRMANLYIKLCTAGSILFRNWQATFHCQPERKIIAQINFGLSQHILSGHATKILDVVKQISEVCDFLSDCFDEWNHHIDIKRNELPILNHFTIEQLVILRKELAVLFKPDEHPSNSVYQLLHPLHQNCSLDNLRQAFNEAFQEINQNDTESVQSDAESISSEGSEDIGLDSKEFTENLIGSGFSKKLALKALDKFGVKKFQEALLWCMEKDSGESDSLSHDETTEYRVEQTLDRFTSDLLENLNNQNQTLSGKLKELWDNYIETVSTSVLDFLSVEHLGHVLTSLEVVSQTARPFPEYLKRGQPNLIICEEGQLLQVVLSLYMHGDGANKPLPQRDEVLLCSADTTAEQVELLLRRAAFDESGKIYCLADVGQLGFDVAQKTETSFDKYCKQKPGLRMIVVCSRETEDRSHIVNYMDQLRVQYMPLYDLTEIQQYLKHKFTITDKGAASAVDPECCSVRLVKSHSAAAGKSLKVDRMQQKLENMMKKKTLSDSGPLYVCIPVHRKFVDVSQIMTRFNSINRDPENAPPRLFHIDLDHEVVEGVDHFLFNLLILGSVMDKDGLVWQRSDNDLYVVETMPLLQKEVNKQRSGKSLPYIHNVLHLLPSLTCWNPVECLLILRKQADEMVRRYPNWQKNNNDQLMDDIKFRSETFQRPYQYLKRYAAGARMNDVDPRRTEDSHAACLDILIRYCGLSEPSWAELTHFAHFLNIQLYDCEHSDFCHSEQDLPGFRVFVVRFMINMSRDFATRSLHISEQTPGRTVMGELDEDDGNLVIYEMKRRWETSPHPYVFFNGDPDTDERHSMTFIGFNVAPNGDIIESRTNQVLDQNVISPELQNALRHNRVPLNEDFDQLPRHEKILRLCAVLGTDTPHDPDSTYELTTDNVKKILAIHMRFRCGIPVIVMGETGCGKTRLVKFMCDLLKPPGAPINNLILIKVHGGTTEEDITQKVRDAAEAARQTKEEFKNVDTVLFFDEANTTDAIGLIKEIMCDHRLGGEPLRDCNGLKFVVACNPYRRHSEDVIKRLEQAGLGYHVKAEETKDRLGHIPMRQLVYRVHALPQSLLPFVWDFGQLNTDIEELYIKQMVQRYVNEDRLPNIHGMVPAISRVLASSQDFMKNQKDECSFVSLRDVDRVLQVMAWFHRHGDHIFPKVRIEQGAEEADSESEDDTQPPAAEVAGAEDEVNDITRMLILALGVCYHASLLKRSEYREFVSQRFQPPLVLPNGPDTIADEINRCQELFLDNIDLGENIAKNQALKENLFMMIMCIELRIPLFLVGKPGSSKSLAKTIVDDAMKGDAAHHELFRHLKQVHMISYQCSPLSTTEGIVATFRQCAQLQDKKDLDRYVAVVVLDEVGLAEDSPLMPLKSLHPLLEDGCVGDETPAPHKKVACVAISNWALDPAKMNRGIHVQRGTPDIDELKESAMGICATNEVVLRRMESLVQPLAKGYMELYESAIKEKREFFGLRDFYSLVKMVYGFTERSGAKPNWHQLKHAILRNFGGLDMVHPVDIFERTLIQVDKNAKKSHHDPPCSPSEMIRASLFHDGLTSETRYLLILTENYAALSILQQELLERNKTTIIFGSSFPKDQEYTQVCRNINRIKICMETGRTVVLLNLENLYESLYDALNQYYVRLGDARFVDLGLGTQRVKCEVHKDFKLVVVAEKKVVYEKFPIPLINRLEKHILTMSTMLTEEQIDVAEELRKWTKQFSETTTQTYRSKAPTVEDVFIGYHVDTPASVVNHVCRLIERPRGDQMWKEEVLERSQDILLQCVTPDSVIRLKNTLLSQELAAAYADRYNNYQKHNSLHELLQQQISERHHENTGIFLQVTTHSKLLSSSEAYNIGKQVGFPKDTLQFASLHAFDTEHQFCKMLRTFFSQTNQSKLLLLQCECGDQSGDLIACARYIMQDEYIQAAEAGSLTHIVLIVQLSRKHGNFIGFQGGRWISYHIDDLHPESEKNHLPLLTTLEGKSLAALYEEALQVIDVAICDGQNNTDVPLENNIHSSVGSQDDIEKDESDQYTDESTPSVDEPLEEHGCRVREVPCRIPSGGLHTATVVNEDFILKKQLTDVDELQADCLITCLDVDNLVYRCLHKAAAMVKDYEADMERKTGRLPILLQLLHRNRGEDGLKSQNVTALDVFHKRICLLLKEKEELVMAYDANNWLSREAASIESVNKAGTFRQAIIHYLEDKVMPLLAGLIAYADQDRNLDLIRDEPLDSWLHQFWLRMFENDSVTQRHYSDLQSLTITGNGQTLTEFKVETSGLNKSIFSVCLPFSWVIYDQITSLLYQAKNRQVKEDPESIIERLLLETPFGHIIQWVSDHGHESEMIEKYLQDFVHMVYKAQTKDTQTEYKIITSSIRHAYREKHVSDDNDSEVASSLTLSGIHLAYSQIQRRINLCTQAIQTWPDVVSKLQSARDKHELGGVFSTDAEMTTDIEILYLMLKEVELPEDFDDEKRYTECRKEWMKTVDAFSPIMERIFDNVEGVTTKHEYGSACLHFLTECKKLWTRMLAVYLFVQHVSPPMMTSVTRKLYACRPLWMLLTGEADLKTGKSFSRMEQYIVSCNKTAAVYYYRKEKCKQCEEPLDNPVRLSCNHYICMKCASELNDIEQRNCPSCKKEFSWNDDLKPPKSKEKEANEHNQYKRRCNSFFMDLVSRLCFYGDKPPEKEVIKRLMDYVTCEHKMASSNLRSAAKRTRTRPLAILKDSIDPTPVVRSFLLQLLLRSDVKQVHDCLADFFNRYRGILADSQHIVELSLLCVYCLEDHYYNQANKIDMADERVTYICDLLNEKQDSLHGPGLNIDKLEAIASVRFALTEAAKLMHAVCVENKPVNIHSRLFYLARRVCMYETEDHLSKPRIYLMKQLFHLHGQECLEQVASSRNLTWLLPEELRQNKDQVRPDMFISLGNDYKQIRDLITKILLGEDINSLKELIMKQEGTAKEKERNILLALYREITTGILKPETQRPKDEIKDAIGSMLVNDYKIHQQDLMSRLLTNRLAAQCRHLVVDANQTQEQMTLTELLVHYWIVINSTNAKKLLEPLRCLVDEPQEMRESYLPTMPEDHLEEVREALLIARNTHRVFDPNPVMWQCPNGHPYVIGNCGRPAVESKCKVCGATIGGTGHTPAKGNRTLEQQDRTAPGHILGSAQQRSRTPVAERLNATCNSILRMLVHSSMYLGANRNSESVGRLVRQPAQLNDISEFLWQHLVLDLEIIAKALGKNKEDAALFMHVLLKQMLSVKSPDLRRMDGTLKTKEERRQWELEFTKCYLTPVLEDFEKNLPRINNELATDNRLGNNALLCLLYEVNDDKEKQIDVDNIQNEDALWSRHTRITIQHLTQEFQKTSQQAKKKQAKQRQEGKVLQLFLKEEHRLRVLRCLPGIVQLQEMLSRKLHRNIDSADATKLTVGKFKKHFEEHQLEEFEALIAMFSEAWNQLRGEIGTFAIGGSTVPAEYCEQTIDDNSCLAMLLPTLHGHGLCATALVHRLVQIHNDFMEEYSSITKQTLSGSTSSQDVTQPHLVSYNLEKDLMPIILANCNYTLTAGQHTRMEYDFLSMERQIQERFIRGRSRITADVSLIVFREEFTNAVVLKQLENKIEQEPLPSNYQQQMVRALRHLTDLNDGLATLDITIGFLVSAGGEKEMALLDFITEKLKMECGILGRIAEKCCLKHTESLWLLLSHERAKLLTAIEQDAFDQLPADYHEEVDDDLRPQLLDYLDHTHQLETILAHLYEFIMLHVAIKPEDPNSDDYVDNRNHPLGYVLATYIESRGYPDIPSLTDQQFPEALCVKHCVNTWKIAHTVLARH